MARVSVSETGVENHDSFWAQISADGHTIVFNGDSAMVGQGSGAQVFAVNNPLAWGRTLRGGAGDDVYQIDNAFDKIVESAGQGTDTVRSSVTLDLADNIEKLVLTGGAAINGRGNALNNAITGNGAANVITGGAGNDTLDGGAGTDTASYAGASAAVAVNLAVVSAQATGGAGTDTLARFENLIGSAYADQLNGNSSANRLDGGAGNDTLTGGGGNDTYVVDSAQDVIVEAANAGNDTVVASIGLTLGGNFENLVLTGTSAIDGTGNASANSLTGNAGANVLDGKAGADTLIGGEGADTYIVDNVGDLVVDSSWSWVVRDTVRSTVSFTLSENVEDLVLAGTGAINGTGNSGDNKLYGNAAANVLDGGTGSDTLIGGEGNDTYVTDGFWSTDQILEYANGGVDTVKSTSSYTLGAELENLVLLGSAENGYGNENANKLTGNVEDNILNGYAGADTMAGGDGDDSYYIDNSGDQVIETSDGGWEDRAESTVSWVMGAYVENLTLTGNGAINGTGNSLSNRIQGNDGANVLDGGTGADELSGGKGNDTYVVDDVNDLVHEQDASGGVDTVRASASYWLNSNVENLTLTGTASINGSGNAQANTLIGNAGSNRLDGELGADTMTGGAGNDIYIVSEIGDKIIEFTDGGIDTVQSSISWTLAAEVEGLELTDIGKVNGTGNALDNTLIGNWSDNRLDGAAGADEMHGSHGNDTYVVDNSHDLTVEIAGEGTDLVLSSVAHTLQDSVENLTLTGTAVYGTGNGLANVLTGNAVGNMLNGGTGIDTLVGGAGNDTYVVDNTQDKTVESAGGGVDTVKSSVAHTLQDNVENLTLIGTAVFGTGNALANVLIGNASANTLNGGASNDTLTGGAGADIFALTSSLGSDLITDFASGADKLRLSQAVLRIGDGDTLVENAVSVAGPNGFSTSAELVVVSHNIAGSITAVSAATAIGHANSNYAAGDTRLFMVDNGDDSAVYLFKSADPNSTVSASELTLLATLDNTASTTVTDYVFAV